MKKELYSPCLILFFFLNATCILNAYITHNGGNVSGTWLTGETHYIQNKVTINDNTTLTIQEGCFIKFASLAELYILGTLDCNGTEMNPIIFTSFNDNSYGETIASSSGSPSAGDWKGISFYGSGDFEGTGYFDYCRVRYGGETSTNYDANINFDKCKAATFINSISEYSAYDGIRIWVAYPTITSSTFSNNVRHGVYCSGDYVDATAPSITNNTFTQNGGYGAFIINAYINSYSGNTGTGNGTNGIGLQGYVKANVALSCSTSAFPFILLGKITINDNFTLTLNAGTIIKAGFLNGAYGEIYVLGTLDVNGTSGSNVVITSIKDDSFGGDTNGDGTDTSPAPGDWYGIDFYGHNDDDGWGYFDYCRIRYGGNTSTNYDANLSFNRCDGLSYFTNSTSEYSGQDGLKIFVSSPLISLSNFKNNNRHGLYCTGDYPAGTSPDIINNTFSDNVSYGAYISDAYFRSYSGNTGSGNGINGFGVQGSVNANHEWTCGSTSFPFILTGVVTVQNNYILTINSPAVIKATSSGELFVKGTVNAVGSGKGEIVFTSLKDDSYGGNTDGDQGSPAPGDWLGIYLLGSYSSNFDGTGNFDYCVVRYGGNLSTSYDANIYFTSAKLGYFNHSTSEYSAGYGVRITVSYPTVNYSLIRNNNNHGLYAHDQFTEPTITNNTFNNNAGYAAYVTSTTLQSYSGNTGSNNSTNGIGLAGTVNADVTWTSSASLPFVITGTITVNDNKILAISGGTVIKALNNTELIVYGTLDVNGTEGNNVIFTSIKDDSYYGDSNGEGTSSLPSNGDWKGIQILGSSNPATGSDGYGFFDYSRIRYGGNTSTYYKANIYFYYGGWNGCYFSNGVCEYSQGYGIRISDVTPVISESNISHNTLDGIYATTGYRPSTAPYLTNNEFNNNGGFGANLVDIRPTSYSGNSGSGNGNNAIGVYGVIEDTPINWNSGSNDFPVSLTGNLTINSGKTLNITGGTLRCNNYNIISSGNFALNSGATIEIGSANGITSSGSSGNIQNGGSRTFSTGANYIYNGLTGQVTGNGLPSEVNKLTCSNASGLSLTANNVVNSELSIRQGLLNNSSKTISVANGATVIVDQGTLSSAPVFLGNVNMEYTGTNSRTTGVELPATNIISDFTLDNVGGVTLNGDIRVNGNLVLYSGCLYTGSYNVILGSSVDNLGNLVMGTGKVVGKFKRWFAASTVNNVLLPIGTADNLRYAFISYSSPPSTGGTLTASFIESNPGENGLPLNNDGGEDILKIAPDGYWIITSGDGLSGGTYNVDLWGDGFNGISDYTKLHLVKRTNGSSPWVLDGTHAVCTGTNDAPEVHRTGLTGFSEFAIGSTLNNPLPVELSSFSANIKGNIVNLNWETTSEISNYGFEIERRQKVNSKPGVCNAEWTKIGFVEGRGNCNSPNEYRYSVFLTQPGRYSFRLKQIENDGDHSYSSEVEIDYIPEDFLLHQNFPNPFNPETMISYQLKETALVRMIVYDVKGEIVEEVENCVKEAGYHRTILIGDRLASGIYFCRLEVVNQSGNIVFRKIIKMTLLK